jgi:hypothetical protein
MPASERELTNMPLRSNFEPRTTRRATRRAQWRALGLSDADLVLRRAGIPGQGVITIAYGYPATTIGGPAVFVAVSTGVIVPEPEPTT